MRGRLRLTWIELGIVVVTLGVGATVAGADRTSRRIRANEASAVATLRLIAEAQEQFKAMRVVDVDFNGVGEYGVLRELAGTVAVRTADQGTNTGGRFLAPALLPRSLGKLNRNAAARQRGYLFKVFLPGVAGTAQEEIGRSYEDEFDTVKGTVHAEAEQIWCCYAWPARHGASGRLTYFLNQSGEVSSTNDRTYSGRPAIDERNAGVAFMAGSAGEGWISTITGTQALGTVGRDGNLWRVVE